MSPCESLPNGHREICEGTSGHSPKKRHAYLMQWLAAGKIDRLPDGYAYDPASEPTPKKSRGLGDTIAKVTTALGIVPCGGCKDRQAKLNKLVPYRDATALQPASPPDPPSPHQ